MNRDDAVQAIAEACDLPPDGWTCTRSKGHPGPCAAWPAETPMLRVAASALCTPIRLHSMQVVNRPCDFCMADAADMLDALAPFLTAERERLAAAVEALNPGDLTGCDEYQAWFEATHAAARIIRERP